MITHCYTFLILGEMLMCSMLITPSLFIKFASRNVPQQKSNSCDSGMLSNIGPLATNEFTLFFFFLRATVR